ncbi:hypothetical protein CF112_10885 [Aeromonas hydrophila]|nr:hypothetical protein CF112_10885 [Aeromonas hydrophila]
MYWKRGHLVLLIVLYVGGGRFDSLVQMSNFLYLACLRFSQITLTIHVNILCRLLSVLTVVIFIFSPLVTLQLERRRRKQRGMYNECQSV